MTALPGDGQYISVRTHDDLLDVVGAIKEGLSCDQIRHRFRETVFKGPESSQDELLNASINLGATILVMIDFSHWTFDLSLPQPRRLTEGTLQDHLKTYFVPSENLNKEKITLESSFNAMNLVRIAGLKIEWTDNLVDHLQLTNEDTKVHIFHHISWLERQLLE